MTDLHASRFNWTAYLNGFFEETDVTVYPNNDTVVIVDMDYFKGMTKLMDRTSQGIVGETQIFRRKPQIRCSLE